MDGRKLEDLPKNDDPVDNCTHWITKIRNKECEEHPDRVLQRKLQKLFGEGEKNTKRPSLR
jgi:hypothetical protein